MKSVHHSYVFGDFPSNQLFGQLAKVNVTRTQTNRICARTNEHEEEFVFDIDANKEKFERAKKSYRPVALKKGGFGRNRLSREAIIQELDLLEVFVECEEMLKQMASKHLNDDEQRLRDDILELKWSVEHSLYERGMDVITVSEKIKLIKAISREVRRRQNK